MNNHTHPSDDGARHAAMGNLPREVMTLVFTDLVGSTRLKQELGNAEALRLIREHHALVRELLAEVPDGREISTAGDSFFLAFLRPSDAVTFALRLQSRLHARNRHSRHRLSDRIGIHAGEVSVEPDDRGGIRDLHGLEVDKCARVMALGHENHILVTLFAFENARDSLKGLSIDAIGPLEWVSHGHYSLKGVAEPVEICEVAESGRTTLAPPEDGEKAHRLPTESATEPIPVARGWRRFLTGRTFQPRMARIGAAISALLGTLAVALVPPLANYSYDLAYLVRPIRVPAEAIIVKMDPESESELQQPSDDRWDRRVHARLIDQLRDYQARAIVLDVLFDTVTDPVGDRAIVDAARRTTNLVIAGRLIREVRLGYFEKESIMGPFTELAGVARWGLSHFPLGPDQIVRAPHPGHPEKSHIATEIVRMLKGEATPVPRRIWLNYYGPAGTIEALPYAQVLTNSALRTYFAGRIVFVGAVNPNKTGYTGGWLNDEASTPYTRWSGVRTSGVEVVATTTLNYLRGDWLRRLPGWIEALVLLATGACAGWGLARLRPLPALAASVVLALLVGVAAILLTWTTRVWFPWLAISAVELPLALAWSVVTWANNIRNAPALQRTSAASRTGKADPPPKVPASPMRDAVTAPAMADAAGLRIPEYSILRLIGQGAYGQIWLARDALGVLRAIKVVQRRSFEDARPFEREFEGIRRFVPLSLEHPGLIRVLHVGRDAAAGIFHYVMELADDASSSTPLDVSQYVPRTLADDLKRGGSNTADDAIRLGIGLAEALEFLHQHHLVHRDLKPANILFVRQRPKLGDVGLVAEMPGADQTLTSVGTPGYSAPEGTGSARADVYGLGKLLYVAATGRPPNEFPELPADLDQRPDRAQLLRLNLVWLKACDPDVSRRTESAAALAAELRALVSPDGH